MNTEAVLKYHERSKHHPHRYAPSPGHLDWENEPRPFRTFGGAPQIKLPLDAEAQVTGSKDLYERGRRRPEPFTFPALGRFLELSLGLAAWKSFRGNTWALRVNPSSGNLHPTEAYLILPALPETGGTPGVFHYHPYLHCLEERALFDQELWSMAERHIGAEGFFVGLTSIYWREAWKYGERAFRYCNLDIGHALACLSFSAGLLGWRLTYLNALSHEDVGTVLGVRGTLWKPHEEEEPQTLCAVSPETHVPASRDVPREVAESLGRLSFKGTPNELSKNHVDWAAIREVSSATAKPATPAGQYSHGNRPCIAKREFRGSPEELIRRRRSAQSFDGAASVSAETFYRILGGTLPCRSRAPFDAELGVPCLHLFLFVHRVQGLETGLYALIRDEAHTRELREQCRPDFLWQRPAGAPEDLPLYLLAKGDLREHARFVSCHQDIASDGVFSLAMIGRFEDVIARAPHEYRALFWEAGMIGQVLYLEAEAEGLRGTGIGCFFDDPVHDLLGIAGRAYQDLYHFTIGKPVEDRRIASYPAYHHLTKPDA